MADKFSDRFPPSVTATKLYERTSAKGNPYLTGRWGGLRVALLKTSEQDSDGHAIWEMRFSAASNNEKSKSQSLSSGPSSEGPRELTYTAVDAEAVIDEPINRPARSRPSFNSSSDDEIPF